jgi:hypothetical protein
MDVYITYLVLLAWELWDPIRTMQLAQSRRKQGTWGPEDQGPGDQGTRGLAGQGSGDKEAVGTRWPKGLLCGGQKIG